MPEDAEPQRGFDLIFIGVLAAIAGALTGFIGGAFRWCLERAEVLRVDLVEWVRQTGFPSWLLPILIAAVAAGVARLLVKFVPVAAGSGVQHVEAVWHDEAAVAPLKLLPVKFIGGVLALGSGLVLGREGPTVQMGATLGAETARRARLPQSDVRLLQTALAGAGLALAFNAPIGGALFVFEEVTRTVRTRLVLTTLLSCAVAVGCSRIILGDQPDFIVPPLTPPTVVSLVIFTIFGLLTGLLGAAYNKLVVALLGVTDRIRRVDPVFIAAGIGALVGCALLVDPLSVGGGDTLSQLLLRGSYFSVPVLAGYLVVRFIAGPVSYAAGTPGGLFAPLLALGAIWGVLFHHVLSDLGTVMGGGVAQNFAIVGMAALFAGIVRAPFTGLVLVVEMTATTSLTVPMLAATASATLAANLVRSAPIYDTLRARLVAQSERAGGAAATPE